MTTAAISLIGFDRWAKLLPYSISLFYQYFCLFEQYKGTVNSALFLMTIKPKSIIIKLVTTISQKKCGSFLKTNRCDFSFDYINFVI